MSALQKHVINDPKDVVLESLSGLSYLNPHIAVDREYRVVHLKQHGKRAHLVTGGGSGHEPHGSAFVGEGMLSAAVCGAIFAAPNSDQVTSALERIHNQSGGNGILLVVTQYTGDVLLFGKAKERFQARHGDKSPIRMVIVGDDVAVGRKQGGMVGRRGLCGTVMINKIAGALAAQGSHIDNVYALAQYIADNSATLGTGLDHCHIPGAAEGSFLKENEAELGMGIHNEPGAARLNPIPTSAGLIAQMLEKITDNTDPDHAYVPFKNDGSDKVILVVNNLGGLSPLELGLISREAGAWLEARHYNVERAISGTFMTSLNMPGFSLTLVLLPNQPTESKLSAPGFKIDSDLIVSLLDAPTEAPGWPHHFASSPNLDALKPPTKSDSPPVKATATNRGQPGPAPVDSAKFSAGVKAACDALIKAEPKITEFDTIAGDGDCGTTLRDGAQGILKKLESGELSDKDVASAFLTIAEVVEKDCGGTSGGLYSIFFTALANSFYEFYKSGQHVADQKVFAKSLEQALNSLYNYTRARAPSRTMIDPLSAFITNFASYPDDLAKAHKAADEAADATAYIEAKVGRAVYVNQEGLAKQKVPDAGAWGVKSALDGILGAL